MQKHSNWKANCADPNQSAPLGSKLFPYTVINVRKCSREFNFCENLQICCFANSKFSLIMT